jgi:putative intracellular protease/amidase/YHS domain-containing protein
MMGVIAGIGSVGFSVNGLARTSADISSRKIAPLPVPPEGGLPAAFVLGKDAEVLDVCGPLEVFAGATTKNGKELFAPYTVAATSDPVIIGGKMKVVPDHTFKTAPQPKVIVIPAMDSMAASQEMCDWIRTSSSAADVTMSVCNGAFVLAKTGLLDGKPATAHHGAYFGFAAEYPNIHLKRGARFVEAGNLASSGGVSSGIDLALRVVERYVGRELTEQLIDGIEYQGTGWLDAASNTAYARMPELLGEHPLCPVCLMRGNPTIKAEYKKRTYAFCSGDHKETFVAHTDVFDRFLAEDARVS